MSLFENRRVAGQRLAERLIDRRGRADVVVLGLPRGGVPVAAEVAHRLRVPLDVLVVRKVGAPDQPELAIGAVGPGDFVVRNDDLIASLGLSDCEVETVAEQARAERRRRERDYRGRERALRLGGREVVLVDDGLATGASMRAAVAAARALGVRRLVVAVPVGAADVCEALESEVDEVVCLATPSPFRAVGVWYGDFGQVEDDAVRALLRERVETT